MRFIILSNLDTGNDYEGLDFFSPLSSIGFYKADSLSDYLETNIPDVIYSSPFLSALQTIYPTCKKYNKYINIDNSLCPPAKNSDYGVQCGDHLDINIHYNYLTEFINTNYENSLFINNIPSSETLTDIKNRIRPFLYKTYNTYKATSYNVCLVTHPSNVKIIIEYLKQYKPSERENNKKIEFIIINDKHYSNNLYNINPSHTEL